MLLVQVMLAIWVRDYLNRKLSKMPDYRLHVDAVILHLWRGAYSVHNMKLVKIDGKEPVPFFSAPMCLQKRLHSGVGRKLSDDKIDLPKVDSEKH